MKIALIPSTFFQNFVLFAKKVPWLGKFLCLVGVVAALWFGRGVFSTTSAPEAEYSTAVAETGTLIKSTSGSGTITSGNSTSITTGATGVVKSVFVSNGDSVTKGQKIAEITLDEYAQEKRTKAWAAYLDSQEAVKAAQKNKASADIEMWAARQAILDAEDEIADKNAGEHNPDTKEEYTVSESVIVDKTLEQSRLAFTEVELKYKNADSEISAAQALVASALADYQELSSTVTAPSAGVVSNLALAAGVTIESAKDDDSDTSDGSLTISSQKIGQIENTAGQFQASVSLTEIDIVGIEANQKVTLTIDAFPEMSFTGKVLAVDTAGSSNSGVTTYPVTILMDPTTAKIYPNMAVSAEIITSVSSNVLLVPSAAVQTQTDSTTIQVLEDGKSVTREIEIGASNGTSTIVTSGLTAGETLVTATLTADDETSVRNSNTTSAFGSTSGTRMFSTSGGSGAVMMGTSPGR